MRYRLFWVSALTDDRILAPDIECLVVAMASSRLLAEVEAVVGQLD